MLAAERLSQKGLKWKSCAVNFMRLCLLVLSKNKRVGDVDQGWSTHLSGMRLCSFPSSVNAITLTVKHKPLSIWRYLLLLSTRVTSWGAKIYIINVIVSQVFRRKHWLISNKVQPYVNVLISGFNRVLLSLRCPLWRHFLPSMPVNFRYFSHSPHPPSRRNLIYSFMCTP